ncbi:hypothetical protein EGR_01615 [Echinococcus granulosus]|uniref:Uncharacterized protein n=1 Tax=Echinococcus granulosus TaxID=6210 RepID=W6UQP0_ECHGR|nr:hypothetical protein EGR_01615 [Echinococcus granulosus]EUB63533.1 hypothetical protein EGR_01615 [Echinococcus granulosus]
MCKSTKRFQYKIVFKSGLFWVMGKMLSVNVILDANQQQLNMLVYALSKELLPQLLSDEILQKTTLFDFLNRNTIKISIYYPYLQVYSLSAVVTFPFGVQNLNDEHHKMKMDTDQVDADYSKGIFLVCPMPRLLISVYNLNPSKGSYGERKNVIHVICDGLLFPYFLLNTTIPVTDSEYIHALRDVSSKALFVAGSF